MNDFNVYGFVFGLLVGFAIGFGVVVLHLKLRLPEIRAKLPPGCTLSDAFELWATESVTREAQAIRLAAHVEYNVEGLEMVGAGRENITLLLKAVYSHLLSTIRAKNWSQIAEVRNWDKPAQG